MRLHFCIGMGRNSEAGLIQRRVLCNGKSISSDKLTEGMGVVSRVAIFASDLIIMTSSPQNYVTTIYYAILHSHALIGLTTLQRYAI